MALSFKNPPLVELIAELRWGIPLSSQIAGATIPVSTLSANQYEELFMRFGSKVAAKGFSRFERIVPSGFPLMLHQPVYRYRNISEDHGVALYQLGVGIFSANITPPYQSWAHFRPVVSEGLAMLIESMTDEEKKQPFVAASLRYIDAFKSDLTQGRSIRAFMNEVLGIKIEIPEAITRHTVDGDKIQPRIQLSVPVASGRLDIVVAQGAINNESAIIMDTTASTSQEIISSEDVMVVFDKAHGLIHDLFVDLTKPIQELMETNNDCAR